MVNIKKYAEKKDKGLISLAKIGNAFVISQKRFNPESGEEVEPEVQDFKIKDLEIMKTNLEQNLADIVTFIEDIKNL